MNIQEIKQVVLQVFPDAVNFVVVNDSLACQIPAYDWNFLSISFIHDGLFVSIRTRQHGFSVNNREKYLIGALKQLKGFASI